MSSFTIDDPNNALPLTISEIDAIKERVTTLPVTIVGGPGLNVERVPGRFGQVEFTTVVMDVLNERARQRQLWGDEHDDDCHGEHDLAAAAATLALPPDATPWLNGAAPEWAVKLRRKLEDDRRGSLVRATALLISELERLDRAEGRLPFALNEIGTFLTHAPDDVKALLRHIEAVDAAYLGGRPEPAAWCPACNVVVAGVDREGLCSCGSNVVVCESQGDAELAIELLAQEREEREAELKQAAQTPRG